jgi:hypothetical protein
VGSGQNQDFPTNKLCLWDDMKQAVVADIQFFEPIAEL